MGEWDEDQHPRDDNGRFSGAGLSAWASKRAQKFAGPLIGTAKAQGGFTYRPGAPKGERTPTSGIMVARPTSEGHVVEIAQIRERKVQEILSRPGPRPTEAQVLAEVDREERTQLETQVRSWLAKAIPAIASRPDHYLGGWYEKHPDGTPKALHLDVSQRFDEKNLDAAIQAGRDRNQLSVWHVGEKKEIATGGTGR